jgi:predicted transcriptional regulator
MPPKKPDVEMTVISLRLSVDLKAEVERLAVIEDRSANSFMVRAIRKEVEQLNKIDAQIKASAQIEADNAALRKTRPPGSRRPARARGLDD